MSHTLTTKKKLSRIKICTLLFINELIPKKFKIKILFKNNIKSIGRTALIPP